MKLPSEGDRTFFRFLGVGALNTLLTYCLYVALAGVMHYQVAYALAYAVGIVLQFVLHSRWVFRIGMRWSNLLGYPPIHLVLYGFGALLLRLLVEGFDVAARLAPLLVIAISIPLSYFLTRRWLVRDPLNTVAPTRIANLVDLSLALGIATFAMVYLVTSVTFIAYYSWRQLLFDQLRQYLPLLERDFPANLLVMENGHRPVFPNLIRHADIVFGQADQTISIVFGIVFALASVALIGWAALRDSRLRFSERTAAILFSAIAVFWLGNTRMLLHANEAIQVSLATLAVVLLASCAHRAARARANLWMLMGAMAAFVATFSFGAGIAAFPALLLLAMAQRVPWRATAWAAAALVATLVLYLFVLPDDAGVRASLSIRPLDSLLIAARWLSGPIVNGWLGLAEPAAGAWVRSVVGTQAFGSWLVASADWMTARVGAQTFVPIAGATIGLVGLGATGWLIIARLLQPRKMGQLEAQALALTLFGAATGVLIGVARLSYFDVNPAQIYADRYGVWPCLMWLGLALMALVEVAARVRSVWVRLSVPLIAVFIGVMAWPSHLAYRGWGMTVYQNAERGAAATTLGVRDPPYLPAAGIIPVSEFEQVVDAMQRKRVSMFADRSADWVGKRVPIPVRRPPVPDIAAVIPESVQILDGENVVAFTGWVGGESVRRGLDELIVIDKAHRVVGIARWSRDPRVIEPGLILKPKWIGFDGYTRVTPGCESLILAGVGATYVQPLARFEPCPQKAPSVGTTAAP